MSSFTITTPSATVSLSPSQVKVRETAKGTVTYSVTNKTGGTIRTALRVKPSDGADASSFTVRGGEERDIGPGSTEDFAVDLAVAGVAVKTGIPAEQRPTLSFHAVAVNLKNPDNDAESGSAVAFQPPVLTGGSDFQFKWWMIAAPVALILIVVGAFFGIRALLPSDDPLLADWTMKQLEDAHSALQKQGAQVTDRHASDLQPATVDAARFYQRIVQSQNPAADGTRQVTSGSTVELVWEWQPTKVNVPELNGKVLGDAITLLEQNGLRFVAAQDPPQPAPANSYPVVRSWNPSGSVDAGRGVTLTMGWQQGGLRPDVVLQFEQLKRAESKVFLRRGVDPQ